jgi:hypothetical protein
MAGFSLLTKVLADFLVGFYLLNSLLNHAANPIQTRYGQLTKMNNETNIWKINI